MTQQQAFDKMVAHLAQQGRRCMKGNRCAYRGNDGTKCVVGAMISDGIAEHLDEMTTDQPNAVGDADVWRMVVEELALEDLPDERARLFYQEMQNVHDTSDDLGEVNTGLQRIAKIYGLSAESAPSVTSWVR